LISRESLVSNKEPAVGDKTDASNEQGFRAERAWSTGVRTTLPMSKVWPAGLMAEEAAVAWKEAACRAHFWRKDAAPPRRTPLALGAAPRNVVAKP
jgi:hypothetical protein